MFYKALLKINILLFTINIDSNCSQYIMKGLYNQLYKILLLQRAEASYIVLTEHTALHLNYTTGKVTVGLFYTL